MNTTIAKGILTGSIIAITWGVCAEQIATAEESKPAVAPVHAPRRLVCSTTYVLGSEVVTCRPVSR